MSIRAVVVDPSAPAHLSIGAVDAPTPAAGDAVIRVSALSLNRGETRGAQTAAAGTRPGWDIAGVIEQPAADGTGPRAGQRVVGVLRTGAWAELVAVPTANIAVLPDAVTFAQASTLPVAGLTALYALDRGDGLIGRNVLITGASGGVGNFGIQIAKHGGARVTGLVRQEKHLSSVRAAGADFAVADETGMAAREGGPFHLVLESVAGQVLGSIMNVDMMAPGGQIVCYGVSGGGPATFDSSVFLRGRITVSGLAVFSELQREGAGVGLTRLANMIAAGNLNPEISVEADWTEIGAVAQQLLDRTYSGKAVLHVS